VLLAALTSGDWRGAGLAWVSIVLFYYASGTAGGALYGALRPIQDRYTGQLLTAYLILFLIYGGGTVTLLPVFRPQATEAFGPLLAVWAIVCLVLAPVYVRIVK
jgi:hypothetical protein